MLFGRRERVIKRILIVEDEPLVAFDNEHFLREAGYEIVATVDSVAHAEKVIGPGVDLVLSDLNLSAGGNGRDVASTALERGVPLMFVTGACPSDAKALAIGCLAKPYSQRDLLGAIDAVDAKLAGRAPKRVPKSFTFFNP
jgi:DNA-binding response OmpR family regulator